MDSRNVEQDLKNKTNEFTWLQNQSPYQKSEIYHRYILPVFSGGVTGENLSSRTPGGEA